MKNYFNIFKMERDNLTILALLSFILMAAIMKPSDKARNAPPVVVTPDTCTYTPISTVPDITMAMPPFVNKPKKPDPPYKPKYFTPTPARDKAALDYIARFEKTAIQEMDKFNIPASITLGQGLLETNWGTSTLYKKALNSFGVKCFSKRCKKGHCMNAADDSHKDFFRIYSSAWESYRDHSKKISQGRYKKLLGKGFEEFAKGLKAAGYATDPNYDKKLIDIIRYYKLDKLDSL